MIQPAAKHVGLNLAGSPKLSESEFAALYSGSYRALWLTAAGILHDPVLAEDVVQDAALVAIKRLDQFQPGTSFVAWAGQIVRNVAQNRFRKERRSRTQSVDPSILDGGRAVESGGTPSSHLADGGARAGSVPEAREIDDRVMHALSAASDIARACLLLRTVEGMEYSEISKLLEIPEGTAMSHVHRTRKLLRDRLDMNEKQTGSPWSGRT
jgi:RNA polymerase sigma-70 factor, ECF subfamily